MADERKTQYRGFEMTSGVDGKADGGFYVAVQWMRLMTQGALMNVPVDGIAAGRFDDLDSAFAASRQRIQQAIDRHIDG